MQFSQLPQREIGVQSRIVEPSSSSVQAQSRSFSRFMAFAALTASLPVQGAFAQAPPALTPEVASAASAFTDSVGVVTHFSYTDTPYYTAFPQVLSALQELGVHHVRDGYYAWPSQSPMVQIHQQLAAVNIKTTYVVPYDASTSPGAIEALASETGDMEALEAPNECDSSGECGAAGVAGIVNAVSFLPTVLAAAHDLGVPAIGPSMTQQSSYPIAGNLDSLMSVNNLHIYFGGRNPGVAGWGALDAEGNGYGSFNWWLDQAAVDGPGLPSEITETGYMAYPSTSTPYTLPESVEASYLPRTLLLSYKRGVKKTFMYELLDEVSSPGYGLLRSDLSQKAAFVAVKNLLSTLADNGTAFTPGSLSYAIAGADSTLNYLLLQKQDGSFWLVLWLEQSSWDPVHAAPMQVTPQNIGVELDPAYQAATNYQFDSGGNVTAFNQPMNGVWTGLTVTDQITILKIVPR